MGKTTLLRDISRTLSLSPELDQDGLGRKVIIVDTSNEIAGKLFWQSCSHTLSIHVTVPLGNSIPGCQKLLPMCTCYNYWGSVSYM